MRHWTSSDHDYAIRTIVGEAADQSDEGQSAVAHVILNRARGGGYGGDTPSSVVLARGQFEPWSTRAEELSSISSDDKRYKRAEKLWRAALDSRDDPTGGATHFLNEDVVRKRRGGTLPEWATGDGQKIGAHTFYGGKKKSEADILDKYAATGDAAPTAPASAPAVFEKGADVDPFVKYAFEDPATSPPPKAAPRDPVVGGVGGFSSRAMSSMPIVGPLMDKGLAALGAAAQPYLHPDSRAPEMSFRERYDALLGRLRSQDEGYAEEHPYLSVGADLAGGISMLPVIRRLPGGERALGMRGANIASRGYQGAVGMGAIETAHQFMKDQDPRDQGLLGPVPLAAAGGFVGPAVGEVASDLVQKGINALPVRSGPLRGTNSATRAKLSDAVEGETSASLRAAKDRHGPEGLLADVNEATRTLAQGLADTPGPQKGLVRETLRQRSEGQGSRMLQSLDSNTVPEINLAQMSRHYDQKMKDAGPLYDAWRKMTVQPTQTIKDLVPRLEAAGAFDAAEKIAAIEGKSITRNFFTGGAKKNWPTAEAWDYAKRGLDDAIGKAYDSNNGALGKALSTLRREMVTEIEKSPAGREWAKARAAYAEPARLQEKMIEGRKSFARATDADELREEIAVLSTPEKMAWAQGARKSIQDVMDRITNGDTTARNMLLTPSGREKLEIVFGPTKSKALIKDLEAELANAQSTHAMVGGSPTSAKQAGRDAWAAPTSGGGWLENLQVGKPATYLPFLRHLTPQAAMEGESAARTVAARGQTAPLLMTRMDAPEFDDLLAAISGDAVRRAELANRLGGPSRTGAAGVALANPLGDYGQLPQRRATP